MVRKVTRTKLIPTLNVLMLKASQSYEHSMAFPPGASPHEMNARYTDSIQTRRVLCEFVVAHYIEIMAELEHLRVEYQLQVSKALREPPKEPEPGDGA